MVHTYIGSPIKRREDIRFLTGAAKYVDDVKLPGMLHSAILRSPHAHARILSIKTDEALAIPGVIKVLIFKDIAAVTKPIPIRMYSLPGLDRYLQYPLAAEKVRYHGEPVAVVIAETRYLAEDALDAIEVTYEPLAAVSNIREALRDEVLIHEATRTNLAAQSTISIGDVEAAFQQADYTRREEFKVHRHTGNPMETRGLVARYDESRGELSVWGPTKVPYFNRGVLSSFLNIPEDKIHFFEVDVGGGFGIRGEFYPEDFLLPFAAITLRRPVKWIEDRREHLMAANHSRDVRCDIEIAARRDGTILGLRALVFGDMGAYVRTHGGIVPIATAALLTGPYRIPNYECKVRCVMTNKTGLGTLRSPGRYESCFIRERLLDMVAADLHIDPVDLRFKNLVQPEEMPYTIGVTRPGQNPTVFDSGNYPMALRTALEKFGYGALRRSQGRDEQGYRGIGVACYVKNTGRGPRECARVVFHGPGNVAVYVGITSLGQGHETTMAQICADGLGIPIEWISVFLGNTDSLPFGGGTFASRGTVMGGNAVYLTAQAVRRKILGVAASHLRMDAADLDLQKGQIYKKGDETGAALIGINDILSRGAKREQGNSATCQFDETAYFKSDQLTYTYGAHVAEVTVDPDTGKIEVLRYVAVEDVGRCVNPLLMHGQLIGGIVQGIGATLLEELVYDENGQLLTTSFLHYLLPTSTDVPKIESIILQEAPSPLNPLGVKGGGEETIVATGAALANAVANALLPLSLKITELPLSPNRVREWIKRGANPLSS